MSGAIEVEGLRKHFEDVVALDGIDFAVPARSVFGLLGPNGAGKTTAIRILATILQRYCQLATMIAAIRFPTTWYPPFTAPQTIGFGFCVSNCAVTNEIESANPIATTIPRTSPSWNVSVPVAAAIIPRAIADSTLPISGVR